MKITKVEYDAVRTGGRLYRRHIDGRWEEDVAHGDYPIQWQPAGVDLSVDLEIQYQQEKEPPRPTMGQMTEEHIIALAKHQLDLADSEIDRITQEDGFILLHWSNDKESGGVLVCDDLVLFSFTTGPDVTTDLEVYRQIASWGYDVMMEDDR